MSDIPFGQSGNFLCQGPDCTKPGSPAPKMLAIVVCASCKLPVCGWCLVNTALKHLPICRSDKDWHRLPFQCEQAKAGVGETLRCVLDKGHDGQHQYNWGDRP